MPVIPPKPPTYHKFPLTPWQHGRPKHLIAARTLWDAQHFAESRGWRESDWDYVSGIADLARSRPGIEILWDLWGGHGTLQSRLRDTTYVHGWWQGRGGKLFAPLPGRFEIAAAAAEKAILLDPRTQFNDIRPPQG